MKRRSSRCVLCAGLVLSLALAFGCGGGADEAATSSPAPEPSVPAAAASATAEATEIFATRCVTCHGPAGAGDGPGSAGLTPPPRDLRDPEWQRSVSDEHIERIVQYGGAAVGRSPAMPGNPDLNSKPDVVAALREHIRGLASE